MVFVGICMNYSQDQVALIALDTITQQVYHTKLAVALLCVVHYNAFTVSNFRNRTNSPNIWWP